MGLGSISRRSDVELACVGPLSQIVRRQGKRSSARPGRNRGTLRFSGRSPQAASIKWQRDKTCSRTGTIRRGFPGLGWGNTCASALPVESASAITMVVSVFVARLSGSRAASRPISELRL